MSTRIVCKHIIASNPRPVANTWLTRSKGTPDNVPHRFHIILVCTSHHQSPLFLAFAGHLLQLTLRQCIAHGVRHQRLAFSYSCSAQGPMPIVWEKVWLYLVSSTYIPHVIIVAIHPSLCVRSRVYEQQNIVFQVMYIRLSKMLCSSPSQRWCSSSPTHPSLSSHGPRRNERTHRGRFHL